jgi:hypothetical protein
MVRWMNSMLDRGYTKGPDFQSYDELSVWDKSNSRPPVRSAGGGVSAAVRCQRHESQIRAVHVVSDWLVDS